MSSDLTPNQGVGLCAVWVANFWRDHRRAALALRLVELIGLRRQRRHIERHEGQSEAAEAYAMWMQGLLDGLGKNFLLGATLGPRSTGAAR